MVGPAASAKYLLCALMVIAIALLGLRGLTRFEVDTATAAQVCRIQVSDRLCGNPSQASSIAGATLAGCLYEGLYRTDHNMVPQLALADSVCTDEQRRTWTFHLRPSRWSNGQPVTAHDFCKAIRHRLSPAQIQPVAGQLMALDGAEAYAAGESEYLGVWAVDDATLCIRWSQPQPSADRLICQVAFLPQYLDDDTIVNGPFKPDCIQPGVCLQLCANPLFWDSSRVQLRVLQFVNVSARHSVRLLELNKLHWVGSPLGGLSEGMLRSHHSNMRTQMAAATLWLRCNCIRGALQSLPLRKKLARVLFRNPQIATILPEGIPLAKGIIPPVLRSWETARLSDHELQAAPMVDTLKLCYCSSGRWASLAALIQRLCADAGIHVELQPRDASLFFRSLRLLDYDLGLSDLFADVGDPLEFLMPFMSAHHPGNRTGWHSTSYQRLCDALPYLAPTELPNAMQQAEELLLNQSPIIPILHPVYYSLVSPSLQGAYINGAGILELSYASLQHDF